MARSDRASQRPARCSAAEAQRQPREPAQDPARPAMPEEVRPKLALVGTPVTARDDEIAANRRARSARLRIAERT